jgi:ABC-type transport system involved in Fe-S cluster assembly fused permease/ATPase subunit
MADLLS